MDAIWTFLKARALFVSVAHDAFTFELSWFGLVLLVCFAFLLRFLRR